MNWEQVVATNVSVKVCPFASTLCDLKNPNAFYYDGIHFNHYLGVPITHFKTGMEIFTPTEITPPPK